MQRVRSTWWGNPFHVAYTIVVFVVLASLDNAAIWLIPSMTKPVIAGTSSSTLAVGVLISVQTLVLATTAVFWGYAADRSSRKALLITGTLVWVVSEALATTASSFWQFFGWQILVAVGLGAIASAGFSVISDFVGPARRGLAMSFWG
ncbi:MAG: MFS transporter, partial [Acidimicrobiia bacterium]